jgi:hypothetical protein
MAEFFSGLRKVMFPDAKVGGAMDIFQRQIEEVFYKICQLPIIPGNFVRGMQTTTVTTDDIVINHMLGREARGFIVVDASGPITLYRSPSTARLPDKQIILRAYFGTPAVYTFSVWVF